jgi:hypothetical protein
MYSLNNGHNETKQKLENLKELAVSSKETQNNIFLLVPPIHKHSVHLVTVPGTQFESLCFILINQLDSALQEDCSCKDTGSHFSFELMLLHYKKYTRSRTYYQHGTDQICSASPTLLNVLCKIISE